MSHLTVAGAGHGGLCAALHLAKAGRRVTVFERQREAALGYDWTDIVEAGALERNGFSALPESSRIRAYRMTMIGPGKRAPLRPAQLYEGPKWVHAERKEWLAIMVRDCRAAGVEFVFEAEILGPVIENDRVRGLRVRMGGAARDVPADMVIDAAGAQSNLRANLPARLGVPGALPQSELFYPWRGIFERLPGPDPLGMYNVYLSHQGRKGLSWVLAGPGSMDVLVGNMGRPVSGTELAAALADLREDNPLLGEQLLRGGGRPVPIPVRRPLGMLVAGGYATVGDSACMADPFTGCGVCIAMEQGRLLAEVLLNCNGDYSLPKLWDYQYRTFSEKPPSEKTAARRAATDAMRRGMMALRPGEVDLMFSGGLIALRGGVSSKKDVLPLLRNLHHPALLWKLAKIPLRGKAVRDIVGRIPKTYDPIAVAAWAREYEGCKMC